VQTNCVAGTTLAEKRICPAFPFNLCERPGNPPVVAAYVFVVSRNIFR